MSQRHRVTVVTPYFAPEHSGTAPYATAVAQRLSRDHDVTVLTGVPHYPQWRVHEGYGHWRRVESSSGLRIVRLKHYVPTQQSAAKRGIYELSFAARALVEGVLRHSDAVIAFTPPVLSTAAAAMLARRSRAPFGVVVHDLAGIGARESGISGGARVAAAVGAVEGRALRRANAVVVLHDRFRAPLREVLGVQEERITVIRNWVHLGGTTQNADGMRRRLGWGDETVVLHTGNMGLKQGLENVVQAARVADRVDAPVRFVLMGDGNQRSALESLGRDVERLNFLDPAPSDDYPATLGAADVLLVNERVGMAEMSVPSKLTSYFLVGRPVVAAADPTSPSAAEMNAAGAGPVVNSGDPEALLHAVLALRERPDEAARFGESATTFAREHFVAERALDRYSAWVSRLLDHR